MTVKKLFKNINWFVVLLVLTTCLFGMSAQVNEFTLKSLYIEHFVTFIEWPEDKVSSEDDPVVIGVFGKTEMLSALQKTYKNKKIMDKEVVVLPINSMDEFDRCQILFIGSLGEKELNHTLNYLKGKPILTISENKGYAEKGVHINFFLTENNVRFEINEKAALDDGLHISHHLLNLAKLVSSRKKK